MILLTEKERLPVVTSNLFKRWTYRFFAPDVLQRATYEAFRRLLEYDHQCHELIADFQDLLFKKEPSDWTKVTALYSELSEVTGALVYELARISPRSAAGLSTYYRKFDSYIRYLLQTESNDSGAPYIFCLSDARMKHQYTGNKAKNLAELFQKLECRIPPGFVITTNSWHALLEHNNLRSQINSHLLALDPDDIHSLQETSRALMSLVLAAEIPSEISQALTKASKDLIAGINTKNQILFAVRSSAVNEDGVHSFAGQYESILNVLPADVHNSYLQVLASKYTPQALLYRITAGISDEEASMAVLILEMIAARAAGVIYTSDPKEKIKDTVFIHSVKGTGEKLVSGNAEPHLICFNKEGTLVSPEPASDDPIGLEEAHTLAETALKLESFFGCPQDIEWVIGDEEPLILQSRPLQTSFSSEEVSTECCIGKDLPLLYRGGITASQGWGTGKAFLFSADSDPDQLPADIILIVENIPSSLILFLPKCSGVVAAGGSVASHFATICREMRIPLLVSASNVMEKVVHGDFITVDADRQTIFQGTDESCVKNEREKSSLKERQPYYRRLHAINDFIAPLTLLDPEASSFTPDGCRSFHDILRYSHEKAVRAMFSIGKSGSRKGNRKKLETELPFELYLVDVDGNSDSAQVSVDARVAIEQVKSAPLHALWAGLTHPSIVWDDKEYYNWKDYDNAAMSDGFAFKNSAESASYAVYGQDYLNLNMRFGYHFTVVDTLCGKKSEQNYCSIRFAGGGGTFEGRCYRLQYIEAILEKIGFKVVSRADLLDARLDALPADQMIQRLFTLGRMLGNSKQMDIVLKDGDSAAYHLEQFFNINDFL